ncbi:membrane protein insertion efficiency factor YidD [Spirulina sp. CS-785/01]|uniref:membrane protein insertion efficiency factor YidD n=1 Tax=Spirulina sp. CS-785/01 TaxID=3021716 RepID=UPI00232F9F8E|nr:membrane protein insertion efficiency factor YidD [Spirulina sp. CS-785/01]MDB9314075.1 membrane protein insertion efficiency factor YidD [Spirulina sp. CS-785/01]
MDKIALKIIQFYQHHLSPHKGFSCAHKAFHRGDSCSQYFHTTIQQQGLAEAIPKLQQRLRDCKTANILLHAEKQHKRDSSNGFCADMSCYGCGCDTPDCDLDTPDCDGCDMPDCGGCDIPCDCSF